MAEPFIWATINGTTKEVLLALNVDGQVMQPCLGCCYTYGGEEAAAYVTVNTDRFDVGTFPSIAEAKAKVEAAAIRAMVHLIARRTP